VNVNDLPPSQKRYASSIPQIAHDTIYFMYAHLSEIAVKKTGKAFPVVSAGQVIGKTGDTGNAKGMIDVGPYRAQKYGAHLHFEVRRNPSLKKGEGNWFDPKPLLNQCD
jgi:murein DD-endopeptidase MepM/ murein hydrolase activator NlpD